MHPRSNSTADRKNLNLFRAQKHFIPLYPKMGSKETRNYTLIKRTSVESYQK